jgi:hypothetical protein
MRRAWGPTPPRATVAADRTGRRAASGCRLATSHRIAPDGALQALHRPMARTRRRRAPMIPPGVPFRADAVGPTSARVARRRGVPSHRHGNRRSRALAASSCIAWRNGTSGSGRVREAASGSATAHRAVRAASVVTARRHPTFRAGSFAASWRAWSTASRRMRLVHPRVTGWRPPPASRQRRSTPTRRRKLRVGTELGGGDAIPVGRHAQGVARRGYGTARDRCGAVRFPPWITR